MCACVCVCGGGGGGGWQFYGEGCEAKCVLCAGWRKVLSLWELYSYILVSVFSFRD